MILVSVTEAMGWLSDFSAIPAKTLARAADRGTMVHGYCAAYAEGLPLVGVDLPLTGYVSSFKNWFDFAVEEVLLVEGRLEDPTLGFFGHPDLIAKIRGDRFYSVVDIKTPTTLQRVWAGQMAAYRRLAEIRFPGQIDRAFSLRLDGKGGVAKVKEYTDDKRDLAAFLSAVNATRYFRKEG